MKRLSLFNFSVILIMSVFTVLCSVSSLIAKEANSKGLTEQLVILYDVGYAKNSSLREDNRRDANKFLAEDSSYRIGETSSADIYRGFGLEYRLLYSCFGLGIVPIIIHSFDDVETRISGTNSEVTLLSGLEVWQHSINVYYRYITGRNSFALFGIGFSYYGATIILDKQNYVFQGPSGVNKKYDNGLWTGSRGYELQAEYNYFWGSISITAGLGVRYAKFKNFDGEYMHDFDIEANLSGAHVYCAVGAIW